MVQIGCEEVPVFEEPEQSKIHNDASHQKMLCFLPVRIPVAGNEIAENPVHQDREDHDQDIYRFTPSIEKQADKQQNEVPPPHRHEIIDCQNNRQICKQKGQTAEYHRSLTTRTIIPFNPSMRALFCSIRVLLFCRGKQQ